MDILSLLSFDFSAFSSIGGNVFLTIVGGAIILLGIIFSVLPPIPGPPVAYLAMFLLYTKGAEYHPSTTIVLLLGLGTLFVTIMDYVIPAWGTKKMGGTKWGVWGSIIGLILFILPPLSLIFGPFGIIIGPFTGALVGELIHGQKSKMALKAAFGSFLGFLFGSLMKVFFCILIAVFYYKNLWI
jgi:uncharacterized protein YqgC (DUF456 family)